MARSTTRRTKAQGPAKNAAPTKAETVDQDVETAGTPERAPLGRKAASSASARPNTMKPPAPGFTRYRVTLALGAPDGRTYLKGEVIDLTDEEARYFNKHGAIGLYLAEGDEAPNELPKPKRNIKRDISKKPAAPTALADSDLVEVDATL